MSNVVELFGLSAEAPAINWGEVISSQTCPFTGRRCYKVRKSDPGTSIGTCTVVHSGSPVVICPTRLLQKRQIFVDCLHLLTTHEPGNQLHIVPEVGIPGGNVDFFLVSAQAAKVVDFVGIELQTLDSTGTVWPERQRLLKTLGVPRSDDAETSNKPFGMNWKMTAKTILVQMHHKVQTFEHVNRKLVLVTQDRLLAYMSREFNFGHLSNPAKLGDSMHLHAYSLEKQPDKNYLLSLAQRMSTDADGIATCLGLQAEAKVELEQIVKALEAKMSAATLFAPV